MTPLHRTARSGRVTIVLPAKDEAAGIGRTLRSLPRATLAAMGFDTEVFVLDGRSRDATPEIAQRWGATVVRDSEPGKGSAVRDARRLFRGDYVIMLDADGTYPPDAIPRVLTALRRGADVVMGHRLVRPGSMPLAHRLGNAALSLVASTLHGRVCPDVCTGLWGFRVRALRALPLRSRRFGLEAELFSLAARLRLRIVHVRVDYLPRTGPAKLSFGSDGLRIVRRLVRSRFAPLPDGRAEADGSPPSPESAPARAREVRA